MPYPFETVDVFTNTRFGGNPLAVIPDARGLTDQQMQQIANEFNLSETTFVLPPEDASHTARVRIFTPQSEVPFAGHPNVGTAYVAAQKGLPFGAPIKDDIIFEEKAGLVRIKLIKTGDQTTGAEIAAPQPLILAEPVDVAIVAQACSLETSDFDVSDHPPQIASAGNKFIYAKLRSRDALKRAKPNAAVFDRHLPMDLAIGIHLYTNDSQSPVDVETRMFAPLFGIPEDPATGSANVTLIGLLAQLHQEPDLELTKTISQGVDMGRPSLMVARASKRDGVVLHTYIGGDCGPAMSGSIQSD